MGRGYVPKKYPYGMHPKMAEYDPKAILKAAGITPAKTAKMLKDAVAEFEEELQAEKVQTSWDGDTKTSEKVPNHLVRHNAAKAMIDVVNKLGIFDTGESGEAKRPANVVVQVNTGTDDRPQEKDVTPN